LGLGGVDHRLHLQSRPDNGHALACPTGNFFAADLVS
jgi:hypothetical protein